MSLPKGKVYVLGQIVSPRKICSSPAFEIRECDLIWKYSLCKCKQVKMRSFQVKLRLS